MVVVVVGLLLLVSLLEGGRGGHRVVVSSSVMRMILDHFASIGASFIVCRPFGLVSVVLEPEMREARSGG